jgi:transcriptional regulator with XRE-family HTH domain
MWKIGSDTTWPKSRARPAPEPFDNSDSLRIGRSAEVLELRALLRKARGNRRQVDIAAAAGVSLSLYQRIESGRLITSRLDTLMRVGDALGVSNHDLALLIQLGRPDLAQMIGSGRASGVTLLSVLPRFAHRLAEVKGRSEALRAAVEVLHATLQPDGMSFVLEPEDTGGMRLTLSIGAQLCSRGFPRGFLNDAEIFNTRTLGKPRRRGTRTMYAGIRQSDKLVAVLGVVWNSARGLDPMSEQFLETIAGIVEVRLSRSAITFRR